jgi:dipeptidyl aminopeptidase/acylaminoacyl peptidase
MLHDLLLWTAVELSLGYAGAVRLATLSEDLMVLSRLKVHARQGLIGVFALTAAACQAQGRSASQDLGACDCHTTRSAAAAAPEPRPLAADAASPPSADATSPVAPAPPSTDPPSTDPPPQPPKTAPAPLLLEGTPPIPPELRQRLNQYLNARKARVASISHDGKSLLLRMQFGQTNQVHVVRQPMGARTQLTFEDQAITTPVEFIPGRDDAFTFLRDADGTEERQLFRLDISEGRPRRVSPAKGKVDHFVWASSGQAVAFNSNARNGKDVDIYISDGVSDASARLVAEVQGDFTPLDWSPNGQKLLLLEYRSITDSQLHVLDLATGSLQRITPEQPTASYRWATFGAHADEVFVSSDRSGEFVQLYRLTPSTGQWQDLSADLPWSVEEIARSGDGRFLAFTLNEGGYSTPYILDLTTQTRQRIDAAKGVIYSLRFARDVNILSFSLSSFGQTTNAFTFDPATSTLTRWTDSEVGGLDTSRFVEPSLIHYPSFDGLQIPAYFFLPPGPGPFPVLISIHGGPEDQARPYFDSMFQYLASEAGVAVLVPNVRGSDGYGKKYLSLDDGIKREDSVKDIGALLDWIATQPALNPQRVGVTGVSYGGYMVLASMIHFPDRIAAGCDLVGVSNFVTFLQDTKDYRRDLRRVEYGDESDPTMRAFLESISPANHIHKIKAPLFIAHGANDPRVPVAEAQQIFDKLQAQHHPTWFMLAPDEGHGFKKKDNKDTFTLLQLLFFEKYLKP